MKNKIKNIIDGLIMAPILLIGAVCVVNGIITLSLPLMLIPLPFMIVSADRLKGDIEGNFIRKSIFTVSRNGFITQDTLRNPLNIFKILKNKDKQTFLINEEFKMFKQLIKEDSKGIEKTYHTNSQALTVKLLKRLEKEGYIKNLTYEKIKKSKLFFEKLLIGNKKKSKHKYQMYKISFNLTDKKIDDSAFYILTSEHENEVNKKKEAKKDLNNSKIEKPLSRQEQIEELKNLRTTFISDDIENNHTKSSKM